MMGLGSLIFTTPWILAALAALPALWWILRLTPPKPQTVSFPPVRILHSIKKDEETPAKTPWWLLLLRIILAALLIIALAGPILRPLTLSNSPSAPMLLVIDNGWASSPDWNRRLAAARTLLDEATNAEQPALLLLTAGDAALVGPSAPDDIKGALDTLQPLAVAPTRIDSLKKLGESQASSTYSVFWISDGIDHGEGAAFAEELGRLDVGSSPQAVVSGPEEAPLALTALGNTANSMTLTVTRPSTASQSVGELVARDARGRQIAEASFEFDEDAMTQDVRFELPVELRNSFRRVEIANHRTAGAVRLLDNRNARRSVGLIAGESSDVDQPLLASRHYIGQALDPFANVLRSTDRNIDDAVQLFVDANVSVIILTDIGTISERSRTALSDWVASGGVLIRFAGDRLAASEDSSLLPVTLRRGGRTFGGTLSWSDPKRLAPFPETSPFAGLEIDPNTEILRQVLATPSLDLADRSWAQLEDGTPLVTASAEEEGWLVLFHVATDRRWTNLALSGTFVEMLRRLTELSPASGAGDTEPGTSGGLEAPSNDRGGTLLLPLRSLMPDGTLSSASPHAQPLALANLEGLTATFEHPPGLYGPETAFVALNLLDEETPFSALDRNGSSFAWQDFPEEAPQALAPWLFLAAAVLLAVDTLIALSLAGRLGRLGRITRPAQTTAASVFLLVFALAPEQSAAQEDAADLEFALRAANQTRLAYVLTGNASIDEITRAGLSGLTQILTNRTALEPGAPMGVDITNSELSFFPILYWVIDGANPPADADTLARVDAYMKQGGTILFDTRDAIQGGFGNSSLGVTQATQALRNLLDGLDVPALEPVPADHVLTKAFYLVDTFPGRYDASALWVEANKTDSGTSRRPARAGDGVSTIMITGNDLAGAWALDETGRPLLPMGLGGQAQREMSYRAGVNIMMYLLTGNYKADQVHIPALLERLGQ